MPSLVDTHCHIQSVGRETGERGTSELWAKNPDLNVDDIIAEASQAGVAKLICVGCDLADSQLAVDFVQQQPNCWASVGIHPHEAKEYIDQPESLKAFTELAERPKVIAVGECGLDYYYGHSAPDEQEKILRFQLELAQKHNLPVIFHVREAFDDFWRIFDDYKKVTGVLHSFTDSSTNLQRALNNGLYIGVNGIATFAKDPSQIDTYKSIPLDRLLLETDAPFLTPTPHRGTINQPKHVPAIANFLAELRGESLDDLANATTRNAEQLFGGLE